MELNYNVTGARRKELVKAIGETLGEQSVYNGPPTFSYTVGLFTIDKNGIVIFGDNTDSNLLEKLQQGLSEQGFEPERKTDGITIELPIDGFTDTAMDNLNHLLTSKGALIKKALGIDALPIERTADRISFPWFSGTPSADEIKAYTHFISAICEMAKAQQRIVANEKNVDNEKYAFRCFLLRLGFIGETYKNERKVLLSKLSGSSAFKTVTQNDGGD